MNGKNHASAKTVGKWTAVVIAKRKSGFQQIITLITCSLRFGGERVALFQAVSKLKFFDDIVPKSAFFKITQPNGFAFGIFVECFHKIIACKFVQNEHTVSVALCLFLLVGQFFFNNFDVVFFRQKLQRFVIRQLLVLHDEMHGRAAFAARKALADIFGGGNIKRWRSVVVKRA